MIIAIYMSERRARMAAERQLDLKQAELSTANRKLSEHARHLHFSHHEPGFDLKSLSSAKQTQQVKAILTSLSPRFIAVSA